MSELLSCYHVNLDLAFFLARPMFNHQISLHLKEIESSDGDNHNSYIAATKDVMEPVIDAIRPLHPSKIWDDISPQFLTTFWSLTMYDLSVPEDVYTKEIVKLKAAPAKVDENKV